MRVSSSVLILFQVVALRISVSAAIPSASELDSDYSYDDYIADFGKENQDGNYDERRDIFEKTCTKSYCITKPILKKTMTHPCTIKMSTT